MPPHCSVPKPPNMSRVHESPGSPATWGPQSVMFTLSATCVASAAGPVAGVQSEPQTPSPPLELPAYPVWQPLAGGQQAWDTGLEHLQHQPAPGCGTPSPRTASCPRTCPGAGLEPAVEAALEAEPGPHRREPLRLCPTDAPEGKQAPASLPEDSPLRTRSRRQRSSSARVRAREWEPLLQPARRRPEGRGLFPSRRHRDRRSGW